MTYDEFTGFASEAYVEAKTELKGLKLQEIKDRFKARKKLRLFYLSLQGVLRSWQCPTKTFNIEFDEEEQKKAEEIWAEINGGFDKMQALIEKYQAEDRRKLKCQ